MIYQGNDKDFDDECQCESVFSITEATFPSQIFPLLIRFALEMKEIGSQDTI